MTKHLVFAKSAPNPELAHVYEHMFAMSLAAELRQEGLLGYLDYLLDAKTYHKGILWFEISLFSDKAMAFAPKILSHRTPLSEDHINMALLQIMAEKLANVAEVDQEGFLAGVAALNEARWVSATSEGLIKGFLYQMQEIISLEPRDDNGFNVIRQEVAIKNAADGSDISFPLAIILSKIIHHTLQEDIAMTSCCYSMDDAWQEKNKHLQLVNWYRMDKRQNTKLSSEGEVTDEVLRLLRTPETAERIINIATSTAHDQGMLAGQHNMLEYGGIFVGTSYWSRNVTRESIASALDMLSVKFSMEPAVQEM
ncbi:hypothetical protein JNJ66_07450 [Candidatus Saccharibacteria bacterium]|nr:hypothetical protein [Candidatus Saccharibacteria bacterium]